MRAAYLELHQMGHAHSIEIWRDGALAGGLYGVRLGGMFFGESMFHRQRDASKVALAHLVTLCSAKSIAIIDCQMHTPHLESLGARAIPRSQYLALLAQHLHDPGQPLSASDSAGGTGERNDPEAGADRNGAVDAGGPESS
jgi:leucyl/phenylalanyl-tRNA--protein transferase